jgi:hypothetical protein
MPLDKVIARHADMWAFAALWTGLEAGHAEGDQIEASGRGRTATT